MNNSASLRGPLVSVVTPTFNRKDYLELAIDSVLSQTYPNFEMVIVDDGSTDGSRELVESYGDSRIRYFYQKNQGQSVARNKGIREASGSFICFLDSDNIWFPDKLEKSIAVFAADPEIDIVYGDGVLIDEKGKEISRRNMRRYSGRITPFLLKDNCVSMNTTMAKRQCFEEMGAFDEADRTAEDYELWLRLSTRYQFRYVPEFMAYYRVMDDQLSSDKVSRFDTNEAIIREFLERFPDAVTAKEARDGLAAFYLRKARYFASVKSRKAACRSILAALRYSPFSLAVWRGLIKVLISL